MQVTFGMLDDQFRRKKDSMLDDVAKIIDFDRIEKILLKTYKGNGRPPIPPVILFKTLLLESWYGLSDVEVVEEIHDRRSFERFVGERVRGYHLDDTTLVKFRERLRTSGALKKVWAEVDDALSRQGFVVKKGAIVDSTLVRSACRPESRKNNDEPVDGDAGYTSRKGQAVGGYKVHVTTDDESGVIRKIEIGRIEEHDGKRFVEMIPDGVERVYADKAYASREHDEYLRAHGIANRILHKAARGRKLSDWRKGLNRLWSGVRSRVERKMADLKRWQSMERMRYYGMDRNRDWVYLCGLACNMKRAVRLAAAA